MSHYQVPPRMSRTLRETIVLAAVTLGFFLGTIGAALLLRYGHVLADLVRDLFST